MFQIVSFFWQLCLLRRSPAQLPSSTFATLAVFLVYLIVALVAINMTRPAQAFSGVAGTVATGATLQALATWLLLLFKGYTDRFPATWTAMLGANTVMLLILLPFNFIILNTESQQLILFADSASWICLGWWLAIAGYIYHKAVSISVLQGSVLAFVVELLSELAAEALFPR